MLLLLLLLQCERLAAASERTHNATAFAEAFELLRAIHPPESPPPSAATAASQQQQQQQWQQHTTSLFSPVCPNREETSRCEAEAPYGLPRVTRQRIRNPESNNCSRISNNCGRPPKDISAAATAAASESSKEGEWWGDIPSLRGVSRSHWVRSSRKQQYELLQPSPVRRNGLAVSESSPNTRTFHCFVSVCCCICCVCYCYSIHLLLLLRLIMLMPL